MGITPRSNGLPESPREKFSDKLDSGSDQVLPSKERLDNQERNERFDKGADLVLGYMKDRLEEYGEFLDSAEGPKGTQEAAEKIAKSQIEEAEHNVAEAAKKFAKSQITISPDGTISIPFDDQVEEILEFLYKMKQERPETV